MKKALALAIGAILMLTACGGTAQSTPATATPSPTPTPTPTAKPAQFASILSENEKNWRDYEDNISECAFARVVGKSAMDAVKVTTCGMTVVIVTLNAKSAIKAINALPTPDAEVKTLVDRTLTALEPLSKIESVNACSDQKSETCSAAETEANGAIRGVTVVLDAWAPYMH